METKTKIYSDLSAQLLQSIFSMTPVYYGMIETSATLPARNLQGGFYRNGWYFSGAIDGATWYVLVPHRLFMVGDFRLPGLSLHTEECTGNTAEYLYTKPCGRKQIYMGKLLCALAGICVTGIFYLATSFLTMTLFRFDFHQGIFSAAGSFILISLFFALLGLMVGIFHPNNRSPLLTARIGCVCGILYHFFFETVNIGQSAFYRRFLFSVQRKSTMLELIHGTICSGICSCCLGLRCWHTGKS